MDVAQFFAGEVTAVDGDDAASLAIRSPAHRSNTSRYAIATIHATTNRHPVISSASAACWMVLKCSWGMALKSRLLNVVTPALQTVTATMTTSPIPTRYGTTET